MAGTATDSKRKTILCVDDDPTLLSLEKKILTAKGYNILFAGDGREAFQVLKRHHVDLLITGINQAPMKGDELLETIREQGSDLPVIILSANVTIAMTVKCMELGAYDFIPKPFKIDELLQVVRSALVYAAGNAASTPQYQEAEQYKGHICKRFLRMKEAEYINTLGKTVLIIDWIESVHGGARSVLKDVYNVLTASDGETGLEVLEANQVDLVLSDIVMSGISGINVLKSIREKDPDLPVVLFSGSGSLSRPLQGLKLGAYDYLERPFGPETLRSVVKYALVYAGGVKSDGANVEVPGYDLAVENRWHNFKKFLGKQDNAQVLAALGAFEADVPLAELITKKSANSFLEELVESVVTVADVY